MLLLLLLLPPALALLSPPSPRAVSLRNLTSLLAAPSYDRLLSPAAATGGPVTVQLGLFVLAVPGVRHLTSGSGMEMTLDLYFRQFWTDPRLEAEGGGGPGEKVVAGKELADLLWKPDTFFVNELHSETKEVFVRVQPGGEVLWSQRLQVTFAGQGDFAAFPWDLQLHSLKAESFKATMADLRYAWRQDGVALAPDLVMDGLDMVGYRTSLDEVSLSSGNYTMVLFDVVVRRQNGIYSHTLFLPTVLVTCLSHVALALPAKPPGPGTILVTISLLSVLLIKGWFLTTIIPGLHGQNFARVYLDIHLGVVLLALLLLACRPLLGPRVSVQRAGSWLLPAILALGQGVFWAATLATPDPSDIPDIVLL
jgi:hypothetical protein